MNLAKMHSDSDLDDFELVDSAEIARHIADDKKPDLVKIRKWLSPTDYNASSSECSRHLASQATGTGEWIRKTSQFKQWHESIDHNAVWIKAVPGAGKSVVAASMVSSLAHDERAPVLFFFFRQIIETNRDARSLVRDFLAQLLETSFELQVALWDLVEKGVDLPSVSTDQLWRYLLAGTRSFKRCYLVVDAMDEMIHDEEFLSKLNSVGAKSPGNVKLLMTSRPKQHLQSALRDPKVIHVSLEEELVKRDITTFVSQRVAKFQERSGTEETRQILCETICKRSEGLFLYARLMLDQISKAIDENEPTDEQLRDMAEKLPIGLEQMYDSILKTHQSLSGASQAVQICVLQLVTQSSRPLRLIEVAKALEANPSLGIEHDSKQMARTACGPLIEIMEDEIVQVIHHSFTEFLLDERRREQAKQIMSPFPILNPSVAHYEIAVNCLAYLRESFSSPLLEKIEKLGEMRREWILKFPFVEYAAMNWPYHVKKLGAFGCKLFKAMDEFCTGNETSFKTWIALVFAIKEHEDVILARHDVTPLHVAAFYGLESWAEHLIDNGNEVNALDGNENGPIFGAAAAGHPDIVRILLQNGAEPDKDGFPGLKPAHIAASRNHARVTKLLLEAGVSPLTPKTRDLDLLCGHGPSSIGETPLQHASSQGHVDVVLHMVPHLDQKSLEESLCWAADGGHIKLVTALCEKTSVPVDATLRIKHHLNHSEGGQGALLLATRALAPECVQVLLNHGAKPDLATSRVERDCRFLAVDSVPGRPEGSSPLHALALAYSIEDQDVCQKILEKLLAAGATLEARNGRGRTPIFRAISGCDGAAGLELFLQAGADPYAVDDGGENLLFCEGRGEETSLFPRLLSLGVDPKLQRRSDSKTPLHVALSNLYRPSNHLKVLVEHGANINARDAQGDSPLISLFKTDKYRNGEQTAEELVALGADVNLQNNSGQTCLHGRCHIPKEAALAVIGSGFNLETQDRSGYTPLLSAIENKDVALVRLLLERGASAAARTYEGYHCLQLALRQRSLALGFVDLLLEYGAKATMVDFENNTILHELAMRYSGSTQDKDLLKKLVEIGVPVNSLNNQWQTPLHVHAAQRSRTGYELSRESLSSYLNHLGHQVDVNVRDKSGFGPLHFACANSETRAYNLIREGADINMKSITFRTPVHCAARACNPNTVAMLLSMGNDADYPVDVNAKDSFGMTPMNDACRSGQPESCRLLFAAGAELSWALWQSVAQFTEEAKIWSSLGLTDESFGEHRSDPWRPALEQCPTRWYGYEGDYENAKRETRTACSGRVTRLLLNKHRSDPRIPALEQYHTRWYGHERDYKNAERETRTAGSGRVTRLLLNCGLEGIEKAFRWASLYKNEDMLIALQDSNTKLSSGAILESNISFMDKLMMSRQQDFIRQSSAWEKGEGPLADPASYVLDMDPTIFKTILSTGLNLDEPSNGAIEKHVLTCIAKLGLVEYMSMLADHAQKFDDPQYIKKCTKSKGYSYGHLEPVLFAACKRSRWNLEMVKLLVNTGVNVNARYYIADDRNRFINPKMTPGSTVLHLLARGKDFWHVAAVNFLAKHGALVDALNEKGMTPLQIACDYRYERLGCFFKPAIVEALLLHGADPNRVDQEGLVPLNYARGDLEMIKILLNHGAKLEEGKQNVLISALDKGCMAAVQFYLENGASCDAPDTSSDSSYTSHCLPDKVMERRPLLVAAFPSSDYNRDWQRAAELVEALLQHRPDVTLPIGTDDTLLHFLFENGRKSTLEKFLARDGFDFNIRDQQGRTVFLAACDNDIVCETDDVYQREREMEHYIPAFILLANSERYGSSIDFTAADNKGHHMLFYLLHRWNDNLSQRFMSIPEVKALVHTKDKEDFSPFTKAAKERKLYACLEFLNHGRANTILEKDPSSNTVLHHFTDPILSMRLNFASENPRALSLCKAFLSAGGDIDTKNRDGATAFLLNVNGNNFDFFVEENKADVRATNKSGENALHLVAKRGDCSGPYGFDQMMEDRKKGMHRDAVLFRKIVDKGCDPLAEDNSGRTALDVAAAFGREEIMKLYERKKEG